MKMLKTLDKDQEIVPKSVLHNLEEHMSDNEPVASSYGWYAK